MKRLTLLIAVAALAAAPAAATAKPKPERDWRGYSAGGAKVLVNPKEKICLGGYGSCTPGGGRTMTGVKDDLYARAIAFSDRKGGSMIVVHTVNIGLFASYKTIAGVGAYHVRQAIAKRTGVPADQVIVQADHSHAGPDTIGIWGGIPTSYLQQLQDGAVDAAVEAWESRRPAILRAGTADGPGITSSYDSQEDLDTDDEFRLLFADDAKTGERIVTYANYSPHATVLGSGNKGASGDWPEWAALIAEDRFGGTGLGSVGTVGREDFGAKDDGAKGEAQARERLERMISDATAAAERVTTRGGIAVRTTFIREPIAQPVLFANLAPEGATFNAPGYDISIDRDINAPWLTGTTLGTFAGGARIGDLFFATAPGESFPELQQYLREEGGVTGPRIHFYLGAANDFLGYMMPADRYSKAASEGALFLAGCPEEVFLEGAGLEYDEACTDHWTLMVSPTMGPHVSCTVQEAALAIRFTVRARNQECDTLTTLDGVAAPAEAPGSAKQRRASLRRR